MPFDAPFQLGPFSIAPDGRIALTHADSRPRFRLHWRGCRVEARLRLADGAGDEAGRDAGSALGELSLHASVGRVPSTARLGAAVLAALRSLPGALPPGWRATLTADHSVALLTATKMQMPTTALSLLTEVTLFLLALGPYLDLLREVGVEPPVAVDRGF